MLKLLTTHLQLMRFHQPTGFLLLLIPCLWGLSLAWVSVPTISTTMFFHYSMLFTLGAILMRAAGCIINDIADRHYDAHVTRTKLRPLASKALSLKAAFINLALLLILAFVIFLQLNPLTQGIAASSLLLVVCYPFMKRLTYWPQLFLGITFNLGAIMGWTALTGDFSWVCLLLYLSGIFWTLGYDTIYGFMDKKDDLRIGIKSSAIAVQAHPYRWLSGFYLLSFFFLLSSLLLSGFGLYSLVVCFIFAIYHIWLAKNLDIHDPLTCLSSFKSSAFYGLFITGSILIKKIFMFCS